MTKLEEAIKVLQEELAKDKSEGSYYYSWQANIAMAFQDEYNKTQFAKWLKYNEPEWVKDITPNGSSFIHVVSNQAAKNFLDLLIKQ